MPKITKKDTTLYEVYLGWASIYPIYVGETVQHDARKRRR